MRPALGATGRGPPIGSTVAIGFVLLLWRFGLNGLAPIGNIVEGHSNGAQCHCCQTDWLQQKFPPGIDNWNARVRGQSAVEFWLGGAVQDINHMRATNRLRVPGSGVRV